MMFLSPLADICTRFKQKCAWYFHKRRQNILIPEFVDDKLENKTQILMNKIIFDISKSKYE